jgi:multiple sugar transport system substrate-binding protein
MSTKKALTVVHPLLVAALASALIVSCTGPAATPGPTEEAKEVFLDVGEHPPITIVINESPWYAGFEGVVKLYEEQTGNVVNLEVTPWNSFLEKQRNAVRDTESPYDILNVNGTWMFEMYAGGFLTPLDEIDPDFKLDPETWGNSMYWDPENEWFSKDDSGILYGVPTNENITLLFYRGDLYEEAGLEPPDTWEELSENCKNEKLHNPPDLYCIAQRAQRGINIAFDATPFLEAYGGNIWADRENNDWTVTINSPEAQQGLDMYVDLATTYGPPNVGALGQGELIQLLTTGKATHVAVITAAWSAIDDPDRSNVAGKVQVKRLPGGPGGHAVPFAQFAGSIPANLPDERKQAAMAFLKWFETYEAQYRYAELGGVPVRQDVLESDLAAQDEFRWMAAQADSVDHASYTYRAEQGKEVESIIGLRYNQAVLGELSSAEALNLAAEEIYQIMVRDGNPTGKLPDLPE